MKLITQAVFHFAFWAGALFLIAWASDAEAGNRVSGCGGEGETPCTVFVIFPSCDDGLAEWPLLGQCLPPSGGSSDPPPGVPIVDDPIEAIKNTVDSLVTNVSTLGTKLDLVINALNTAFAQPDLGGILSGLPAELGNPYALLQSKLLAFPAIDMVDVVFQMEALGREFLDASPLGLAANTGDGAHLAGLSDPGFAPGQMRLVPSRHRISIFQQDFIRAALGASPGSDFQLIPRHWEQSSGIRNTAIGQDIAGKNCHKFLGQTDDPDIDTTENLYFWKMTADLALEYVKDAISPWDDGNKHVRIGMLIPLYLWKACMLALERDVKIKDEITLYETFDAILSRDDDGAANGGFLFDHDSALIEHESALFDLDTDIQSHKEALQGHENTLAGHTAELTTHTAGMSLHDNALGSHNATLNSHATALLSHGSAMTGHDGRLGDHAESVDERLSNIEARLASLEGTAATLIELQHQILQSLATPPGRRRDFPTF